MTPPINSVRLDELARWAASEEADCLQDDMPVSAGYYADIIKLTAARRAANTPVDGDIGECRYCANTGWFYGEPDLQTFCGCAFGKLREEISASPALPSTKGHWSDDKTYEEAPARPPQAVAVSLANAATALERSLESEGASVNAYLRDDIEQAIAVMRSCLTSPAAEPVAWTYELATRISHFSGEPATYHDFEPRVSFEKPNVPEGSIRNLRALAPSASREVTERIHAILNHPSPSPAHDLGAIRAALSTQGRGAK